MLNGKPAIFIAHSNKFRSGLTEKIARMIEESTAAVAVIVENMPRPETPSWDPEGKVNHYLRHADMFVALLTPDNELKSGEIEHRHNVTHEIATARSMPHLEQKIQVLSVKGVSIPSNINPAYDELELDDPRKAFSLIVNQAMEWGVLTELQESSDERAPIEMEPTEEQHDKLGIPIDRYAEAGSENFKSLVRSFTSVSATFRTGFDLREASFTDAMRINLATHAIWERFAPELVLGVHQANRIYANRAELQLSPAEKSLLFRAVLSNSVQGNVPGWFWKRDRCEIDIQTELWISTIDQERSVRLGALDALGRFGASTNDRQFATGVRIGLTHDDISTQKSVLRIAGDAAPETVVKRIQQLVHPIADSPEKFRCLAKLAARHDLRAAARIVTENPECLDASLESLFVDRSAELPKVRIKDWHASSSASLRRIAIVVASREGSISASQVRKALSDEDLRVAGAALDAALKRTDIRLDLAQSKELADRAKKLSPFSSEMEPSKLYGLVNPQELLDSLDRFEPESYEALGTLHFENISNRIRQDLDTDFEAFFVLPLESEIAIIDEALANGSVSSEQATELRNRWIDIFDLEPGLLEFQLNRFRVAALRALALNGRKSDVRYGRRFIGIENTREVRVAAAELLSVHGSRNDFESIRTAAEQLTSDAERLTRIASELSPGVGSFRRLLASDSVEVVSAAIDLVASREIDLTRQLRELVDSDTESIRQKATIALLNPLPRWEREKFLKEYETSSEQKFYNVVAIADSMAYAKYQV